MLTSLTTGDLLTTIKPMITQMQSTTVAGEGDIWDTWLSQLTEKKVKSLSHV